MGANGRLRLGVIGCGRVANTLHLPAIAACAGSVELVVLADVSERAARKAQAQFNGKRHYTNMKDVFRDEEVDAVVILLPHHLHEQATIEALESGKHVLVEKPLALSVDEADRMIAAAARSDRNLMVGHNRRFFKASIEAKKRMSEIGRPLHMIITWFRLRDAPPSDWWSSIDKTGGLLIPLNGSHAVDMMMWLVDKKPVRVFAEATQNNPRWQGEDEVAIVLSFDDGLIGTIMLSFNSRVEAYERYIIGTQNTMLIKNEGTLMMNGEVIVSDDRQVESFKGQIEEFAASIRERREPIASGTDVRKVVEVLTAAITSAREKRVITLN